LIMKDLKSFEDAFKTNTGGCRGVCECGKQFYNSGGGWNWEDGEIERLREENAQDLDRSVGFVRFENKEYCRDCDCWHKRANDVMGFIDTHNHQIAKYLSLEKERALKKALDMPEVE